MRHGAEGGTAAVYGQGGVTNGDAPGPAAVAGHRWM